MENNIKRELFKVYIHNGICCYECYSFDVDINDDYLCERCYNNLPKEDNIYNILRCPYCGIVHNDQHEIDIYNEYGETIECECGGEFKAIPNVKVTWEVEKVI